MKYFAEINKDNIVINIIVANDNFAKDNFIQYTYDKPANIGDTYDSTRDAFIAPKTNCHPEETLDEATCRWICTNPEHEVTNANN